MHTKAIVSGLLATLCIVACNGPQQSGSPQGQLQALSNPQTCDQIVEIMSCASGQYDETSSSTIQAKIVAINRTRAVVSSFNACNTVYQNLIGDFDKKGRDTGPLMSCTPADKPGSSPSPSLSPSAAPSGAQPSATPEVDQSNAFKLQGEDATKTGGITRFPSVETRKGGERVMMFSGGDAGGQATLEMKAIQGQYQIKTNWLNCSDSPEMEVKMGSELMFTLPKGKEEHTKCTLTERDLGVHTLDIQAGDDLVMTVKGDITGKTNAWIAFDYFEFIPVK